MQNAIVQARVDSAAKAKAEAVLSGLGLSLSDGIRLFIHQVGINRGIPFIPSLEEKPNAKTEKAMKNALIGKNIVKIGTVEDFKKMYKDL